MMEAEKKEGQTNLIVNYLPLTMTDDEFKLLFMTIGPLKSHKVVRDKVTSNSFGFGFVDYKNGNDAQRAVISLNGLQVQNKQIKVALAKSDLENELHANLYIRNLPKDMKDSQLEVLFKDYGKIMQSRVLIDLGTGESKGVGFVMYSSKSEADKAIQAMSFVKLPGCDIPLVVKYADDNSKKIKPNHQASGVSVYQGDLIGGNHGSRGQTAPIRNQSSNMMHYSPMGASENMCINNNYSGCSSPTSSTGSCTSRTLLNTSPCSPSAVRSPWEYRSDNNSHPPSTLGRHGTTKHGGHPTHSTQPPWGGHNSITDHHLNLQNSLGEHGSVTVTDQHDSQSHPPFGQGCLAPDGGYIIHAYNIGYECTDSDLSDLFRPYGTISRVNVMYDHQRNQCKGFGFVTMSYYREAEKAIINLNGRMYKGRVLSVSFKKEKLAT